ncbi:hypothetical protein [Hydrogenophilus thiooxidans]|uniref:hypothetical protein n=1 Tax=Hydrogenophilus thiooxidans TaxID=2820326 RepID=UPI001C212655|nr:hypothetical protein [Hydrogenophilus thiooxidans]
MTLRRTRRISGLLWHAATLGGVVAWGVWFGVLVATFAFWLQAQRDPFTVGVVFALDADAAAQTFVVTAPETGPWQRAERLSDDAVRALLRFEESEPTAALVLPPVVRLVPREWEANALADAVGALRARPDVRQVVYDALWLARWQAWQTWGTRLVQGLGALVALLWFAALCALIAHAARATAEACALRFALGGGRIATLLPLWQRVWLGALLAAGFAILFVLAAFQWLNPAWSAWLSAYGFDGDPLRLLAHRFVGAVPADSGALVVVLSGAAAVLAAFPPALVVLAYPLRALLPRSLR